MDKEGAGKEEHNHGCTMCIKKLDGIQKKVHKVLPLLPKIKKTTSQGSKALKVKKKNALKVSSELSQAEIAELPYE